MTAQVIQAFPPGLLSAFGIKNGGSNPQQLGELLVPTLELLDWYLAQQWITQRIVNADIGAGPGYSNLGAATTVPQNQVWFVRNVTTGPDTAIPAGNASQFWLARRLTPVTSQVKLGPTVTLVAGQRDYSAMSDNRPYLLRPGDDIGVFRNTDTHVLAQDWRITFEYVPLLI